METTVDYPRGVTFEQVWAMMQENALQMKETDRIVKENAREIKELSRQMGGLHNSFGELAEHLVAPGIAERFNELGHHFDAAAPGGFNILDDKGKEKAQIDILLVNSECVMAVEVKTKPRIQDINHHIKRLEILREYHVKHKDSRKIYGAVAGAVFENEEKQAAIEAGFYVIVQSGDTMKIEIPAGFVPQEW